MSVLYAADDFTDPRAGRWSDASEQTGSAAFTIPVAGRQATVHASRPSQLEDPPLWLEPLVDALDRALRYAAGEPEWSQIEDATLECAVAGIVRVLDHDTAAPSVTPTPEGGLQFEWHEGGWDLEVEVVPDGGIDVWGAAVDESAEFGGELDDVVEQLRSTLRHITADHRLR